LTADDHGAGVGWAPSCEREEEAQEGGAAGLGFRLLGEPAIEIILIA
jgi:hypothetical protein